MTIAITGATGQLGRLVVGKLKEKLPAREIVALARTPEKAADLGIAARAFDYDRPDALAPALAGIDTLLLISSSEVGKRGPQHAAIVAAAREAGVGRIVYTSLLRADTTPLSLGIEHAETERVIAASGIPHIFLRNGWYLENYAAAVQGALAHGALIGAAGGGRIAAASRADYADAAVAVLLGTGHDGKTYELAGDTAFTLAEGRAVSFRHVIGAVPRAGREPPASLAAEAGRMRLSAADGATRDIPFDGAFLRIGRTVAP